MSKKLIYVFSFVLVLGLILTSAAKADLIGWWRLDEGSGTIAYDSSGNGNDGTLVGDPQWVAGMIGGALECDGDDHVDTGNTQNLANWTIAAWVISPAAPSGDAPSGPVHRENNYQFNWNHGDATFRAAAALNVGGTWYAAKYEPLEANTWYHLAATYDGNVLNAYRDGELITSNDAMSGTPTADGNTLKLGRHAAAAQYFTGTIDDARVYDEALTQAEIQVIMQGEGFPFAFSPSPADGALHKDTWVSLNWRPGDSAVSHDVYLGDNFDDVNDGTGDTFRGNQPDTFFVAGFPGFPYPDGLVPGTTYFWRIDEVNDQDPNSPWKGSVWSFTVPPRVAYDPSPSDGAKFVSTDVTLSWTAGFGARLHTAYVGDDFDAVSSAAGGLPKVGTTYTPDQLAKDTVYYWRVDEFDGITTLQGDVWSFKTLPDIPITDPNLMGWWKLDEGIGTTAVDWSGYNHHGTFNGDPEWVAGYDGGALEFDGDDYVDTGYTENLANWTITAWVISPEAPSADAPSGPVHRENNYQFNWNHGNEVFRGAAAINVGGTWYAAKYEPLVANRWYHLAATYDGDVLRAYRDGVLITSNSAPSGSPNAEGNSLKLGRHAAASQYFTGIVDDARVYNRALTVEEIQQTMRGDPMLAWNASPANNSIPNLRGTMPLSWSPGDKVAQHDVYFGTDEDAVTNADASDTTGVYRGRQSTTNYTPPEGVEWGGGPYYWRIDEYNTDETLSIGRVWSFTVADYLTVDDFESYNDLDPDDPASNRIFLTWMDGYDTPTNGSVVGYDVPPFCEQIIVHSGGQSMPLFYDNSGPANYSEATLPLTYPRDWTEEGVGVLTLWFRGQAS